MRTDNNFIQTFTGRRFYPLDPSPYDVYIEDIAHALALQCRWTGHCKEFYSVAQHSVLVSEDCKREDALCGLLHDASEAYMCDLARPIKHDPRAAYYFEAEKKIMAAIAEKFGLEGSIPQSVIESDNKYLLTERRDLLVHMDWGESMINLAGSKANVKLADEVLPWTARQSEISFLRKFEDLTRRF